MNDYPELRSLIGAVRRRWVRLVALRTIGRAAAGAAVPVFGALAVEYLIRPDGPALVLLVLATFALAIASAVSVCWRRPRRPDDRHVARFIEERSAMQPGGVPLDDVLVSAVEVTETPQAAGAFRSLVVAAAIRRLRDLGPAQLVGQAEMRRAAAQALAGMAILIAAAAVGAPAVSRALETARLRFFPQSIEVAVVPGDARVAAGTPLRIRASVRDGARALVHLAPSLVVEAGGQRRTVEMVSNGGAFEYAFESVDRTFKYAVVAGTARSREYTITALMPARVRSIDLQYAFPSFSGLAPRDEPDGGDIYGPAGTRVHLRIHTDKPVTAGEIVLGDSSVRLRSGGDRLLEGELIVRADDSYRVTLADIDGLRSSGDTEYFIRVMDDRPADVRLLRPSGDQQITPLEEVSIEARADDDYGIAAFDLVYAVAGGPERVAPFDRIAGTAEQKVGSRLLRAEELGVRPGDVITYYARARDVARGKRSTETKSDIFFLEVKPFNEEFVAATSQATGGAASAQIESLIEAQKEIISATWNVERRSQSGRSADDMKAIAQAQTELKARAVRMGSRGFRGAGGMPPPQRPAPQAQPPVRPGAADPIARAIDAMTKAVQQLEERKTKDAIPFEMAALNGLLQAQAEVRRRQVSQQASGAGSGGGNRQGQDLSALFDKELQRQQRTNYETRSQVEERPDQASNDTALDRIRDLARRQEDLNQRQRELAAAALNPEELKRQLEKLTREQTELRQQVEQLSREMSRKDPSSPRNAGGQRGQPSASASNPESSPSPGGQSGQGGMREAIDEMRSAAGDLRRENPDAAAKSGARAAEQLRRAEQQIGGGDPDTRQRVAGELQLEARQIAQEQQRIASEAERLDTARGSTDAARRLADEKERLAARVDDLQRSARQLTQANTPGPESAAVGEAGRELERQRIGQRMRDTAKQMREAGQAGKAADAKAELEIARALDRVVDKLGGKASGDTRALSEQLDRTRDLRDRLNRLEQQIREAEARHGVGEGGPKAGQPGPPGRGGTPSRGESGNGQGGEIARLQQEYQRELQRAREGLDRLAEGEQRNGMGGTPERHEFSRSAPGTESFKQDRSGWESLRKELDLALERYEATVSDRLARDRPVDRFSAGGSDRVPDSYQRLIARYYRSLAKGKT